MKKIFRRKKKSASEAGSIGSGLSGSAYNISPKKDLTKLHRAAFEGDLTKLKSLLKRADVNQLDKENRTPLHLACANGKYDAVRMLAEHSNINLNLCDNERKSALMKCVQCEHQTCLKILLDKGADVSLSDENGSTALHIAASIPNSDICYLLADYHANANTKNKDGATPLHVAASLGSDEIVKLMLGSGVDINDLDDNEKTPLMHAAHKGHLTTVQLLLDKNADAALRDLNGWTADDYASMDGHHPISHIIMEHNKNRGPLSAQSRQSTITRNTPKTTPQRLGARSSSGLGSVTPQDLSDESDSEDSFSSSKASDKKYGDSWASSNSEDDEPKYASVKKPVTQKISVSQILNQGKANRESTSIAKSPESKEVSPPKANPFLTASARLQMEKQQQDKDNQSDSESFEEQDIRPRYDSKSSKGLPVSPSKPPLPAPRKSSPMAESREDIPTKAGYTPSNPVSKNNDNSSLDSDESDKQLSPAKSDSPDVEKSDKKMNMMKKLGFDHEMMKELYNDEDTTTEDHSEVLSPSKKNNIANTSTPKKSAPSPKNDIKQDDSDSWDSFSEKFSQEAKDTKFDYLAKSSNLKFDDELSSEGEDAKPTAAVHISPTKVTRQQDDDDEDSWNSDVVIKSRKSPQKALPEIGQKNISQGPKKGLGISYQNISSDSGSESDLESESSWEKESKTRSLNNQRDVERQKKEEEERIQREKEDAEALLLEKQANLRRLEEEKKKLKLEEERKMEEKRIKEEREKKEQEERKRFEEEQEKEEKRKREEKEKFEAKKREQIKQAEERRKKEEEDRRIEEMEEAKRIEAERIAQLEKMNRMNEELEKRNAELRRKAMEDEKKMNERAMEMKIGGTRSGTLSDSLRGALKNAAEVPSDSSESSGSQDGRMRPLGRAGGDIHALKTINLRNAPEPAGSAEQAPYDLVLNDNNLDTLTEETESEEDFSLSDHSAPAPTHSSTLSDSIKLAEEKQSLSLQLSKEKDSIMVADEKLEAMKKENKQLKLKERTLVEEKRAWELERVEMNAENRKLSFDVKNLTENLETLNLRFGKQEERCKRMEDQLQVEREEKRELEVTVRDLRLDLKNSNATTKQAELKCEELARCLAAEKESNNLAKTISEDNFKLTESLQNEALKDDHVETLEQVIQEKNQELIKAKAERDRYEDASARYKEELVKLRAQDADQHGAFVQVNRELNDKLDEKELELRESEEALQLTALQSMQYKQAYDNATHQLSEERREKDALTHDLSLLKQQQIELKADIEEARSNFLREQERTRKLEEERERMREKENELQASLLAAETKASRFENELQISNSSNKQRAEDNAKWENECEKLRDASKENEKSIMKLEREIAEQSGKIEAMKVELQQRETECIQMRQEKEDLQSRTVVSASEQQDKFNAKLVAIQREHENERVAFETRNVQLTQQIEHWKSEVERIKQEKIEKEEELAQAQQDRIETHKKLGYADAFSKSASKEQKHLMDENTKVKEDNVRLQSQVTLLEQKLDEKSSNLNDLQKEIDQFYHTSANANRQIDSLSESQRLAESGRVKLEQQLKEAELENIRLKSELESTNSWKDRLQESREQDAHAKAMLEEKISKLECDRVLAEEKFAAECASSKILRSEAEGHKTMWEAEVKSRSKLEVELSKAVQDVDDKTLKLDVLRNDLTKALKEKKSLRTKFDHLKREKAEIVKRAESYRSAMHNAGRKAADTESECESQMSMLDEQHAVEISRREKTIAKLREQVTDLMQQLKDMKKPYFPEGPTDSELGLTEVAKFKHENDKLKEQLKQLRAHVKDSYVDKAELEAARQEERIKAQATLAPTLDQVNSFLKNQQIAQEFRDQLIQKREENTAMKAAMRIAALEEELRALKRKQDDESYRMFQRQEAETSQLYESAKRKNEVLEQQLARANGKVEEYKGYWIKERKKFQNFFTNTLGGSIVPNGVDSSINFATNSFAVSPTALGKQPLPGGAYSSTPKQDSSDPLLTKLRSKLDATIAERLSNSRDNPLNLSAPNAQISTGSNSSTPRSGSSNHQGMGPYSGHKSAQNEYMSFLLS